MNDPTLDTSPEEAVRALLSSVVKALVDEDDKVTATLIQDGEDRLTVVLRVSPADLGKLIGRRGRTARSLRSILQAAGTKHQLRFSLDIDAVTEAHAS